MAKMDSLKEVVATTMATFNNDNHRKLHNKRPYQGLKSMMIKWQDI